MSRIWFKMEKKDKRGEILIYDTIGKSFWNEDAVGATDFEKELKALGEVDEILLRINSPGGDVMDGVAIYNMLDGHKAKIIVNVDALAASAASLIAMAGDEINMPENSFMLVHKPSAIAMGNEDDFEAVAADLKRMTQTFASTYAKRSGMKEDEVMALMTEDRLMTASEAKEKGFADKIGNKITMSAAWDVNKLEDKHRKVIAPLMSTTKEPQKKPQNNNNNNNNNNVVDLDKARSESRAEALKYSKEITELCMLAGKPKLASQFIADQLSMDQVREKLINARALEDEAADAQNKVRSTLNSPEKVKSGWKKATDAVNNRLQNKR